MSDDHAALHRDLGRLESTVEGLDEKFNALDERIAAIDKKLDAVVIYIETAKAQKRTFLAIGSTLGSIGGGLVAWFVSWWEKTG